MDISAITQSTSAPAGDTTKIGGNSLGSEAFMQLLVTQLQYQDPMEPQSGTEFTAQLAQFSSLEQLTSVNKMLEQLASLQAATTNTQVAAFIGQEVTAVDDGISVAAGVPTGAEFKLDHPADTVRVTIRNSADAVVRVIEMGNLAAGTHNIEWDGKSTGGVSARDGSYNFEIEAKSGDSIVDATTLVRGTVTGIDFDPDGTFLLIGGHRVALGDVLGVRAPRGGAATQA